MPIGPNTLMANDVPEIMGRTNENEKQILKFLLAQKSREEADKNILTGFQQAEILKCLLVSVPGVPILRCLETNMVLNGWWNSPQDKQTNVTEKKPENDLADVLAPLQ